MSEVTAEAVEAKREELGLNDPVPVQYGRWLLGVLRGDLGTSYSDNTSVSGELLRRLPVTLKLTGCSLLLVVVFGITGGIVAAACSGRAADTGFKLLTNLLLSFPSFWLAILLIMIFAENLKVLPTSGMGTWKHWVLPAVTLSGANIAMTQRLMRSSLLTEFGKQYMLAANAKGNQKWYVLFAHAVPNAIIPVITLIGNYVGGILGGSFIIEIFSPFRELEATPFLPSIPEIIPVIQGYVLVTGCTFVLISLAVDLLCAALNPKMRLGGKMV